MEASLPDRTGNLGLSPYADPREVEHPLTPLNELGVLRLAWVQPRLMHPAYELWGGDRVAATLRFRDLNRREALAASADFVWLLQESPREGEQFTVHARSEPVAAFRTDEAGQGALFLSDDRMFVWVRPPFRGRTFAFIDADGNDYLRFEDPANGAGRIMLSLSRPAALDPECCLLAVAGMYLSLSTPTPEGRRSSGGREA